MFLAHTVGLATTVEPVSTDDPTSTDQPTSTVQPTSTEKLTSTVNPIATVESTSTKEHISTTEPRMMEGISRVEPITSERTSVPIPTNEGMTIGQKPIKLLDAMTGKQNLKDQKKVLIPPLKLKKTNH